MSPRQYEEMTTTPPTGMLDVEELAELVESGEIDTVITAFPDLYGRLLGKRITGEFFLEHTAGSGMHACDYLFTVDMDMEPVPGYRFANWERGYGDFHAVPDLATLRRAAWLDRTAIVLCHAHTDDDHQPVAVAPRTILSKQVAAAHELGYVVKAASEIEYFIVEGSYRAARAAGYRELQTAGDYIEDYHILQGTREEPLNAAARRHLQASGVPVEFSKGEWGPGQHELNIRYAEVDEMADRHTLYKQCLKDIAGELGMAVTFMAKLDAELAGSSCHMHVSLWDAAGEQNVLPGGGSVGPVAASDAFRWFLGGWIAHAAEMMAFYAPTVNSYKRYQAGSWAPTALAWSYDNRTAGFRVVGRDQSLRIESRLAGADVNPYLGHAAAIASGLDGIRNRTEPPEHFDGDAYAAADTAQVPRTLREATGRLDRSEFARAAVGDDVVDHYVHFLRTEQAAFDRAVTDWERHRYFEQI